MKYLLGVKSLPVHTASCVSNAAEFPVPPFLDVLKHADGAAAPEHPDHQHKVKNQPQNQPSSGDKQHDTQPTGRNIIPSAASIRDTVTAVWSRAESY